VPELIAIYLRVSSRSQDTASQEPDLKRWAEGQKDSTIRWYRDKVTGTTMERPGFQRLLQDIRLGKVNRVAVWRLDRLGRTAKGLTALFEDLLAQEIALVSLKEGLDLKTPSGRLMANVLASVAMFETEIRSERVVAGQVAARSAGRVWGGSVKGRRLKVTPEQESVIRRMKSEGETVSGIGRATGLSRPTVYRVLGGLEASATKPVRRKKTTGAGKAQPAP
jgi:DNA invertase Pin-like site-specific DNA recombinase